MMFNIYSNLTGKNYTVKHLDNGRLTLRSTLQGAPDALPIVAFDGPYHCPYHNNDNKAAECIQRAPVIKTVEDINIDLAGIQARSHKKYLKSYIRQVLVCKNPDPRFPIPGTFQRTKEGYLLFLAESGCYHFRDKSLRGFPQRCLICSNLVKRNPYGVIWKVEKNMSSLIYNAFCLRCNSRMHFGSIGQINAVSTNDFNGRKKYNF